jgi:oligopeptide transport system substrate-binding protein
MTFLDLFVSDSSFNTQKYSNPQYDKLIAQAKEELDEKKRMDMLLEAERVLVEDDAGTAPMYFQGAARLQKPSITKYVNHPLRWRFGLEPLGGEGVAEGRSSG